MFQPSIKNLSWPILIDPISKDLKISLPFLRSIPDRSKKILSLSFEIFIKTCGCLSWHFRGNLYRFCLHIIFTNRNVWCFFELNFAESAHIMLLTVHKFLSIDISILDSGEYVFHCQLFDSEKNQLTVKISLTVKNINWQWKKSADSEKYHCQWNISIDSEKNHRWYFSLSKIDSEIRTPLSCH